MSQQARVAAVRSRRLELYGLLTRKFLLMPQVVTYLDRRRGQGKSTIYEDLNHLRGLTTKGKPSSRPPAIVPIIDRAGIRAAQARNPGAWEGPFENGATFWMPNPEYHSEWEQRVQEFGWDTAVTEEDLGLTSPASEIHHVGVENFRILPGTSPPDSILVSMSTWLTGLSEEARKATVARYRKQAHHLPPMDALPVLRDARRLGFSTGVCDQVVQFTAHGLVWTFTLRYSGSGGRFVSGSLWVEQGQRFRVPSHLHDEQTGHIMDIVDVTLRTATERFGLALSEIRRAELHHSFAVSALTDPDRLAHFLEQKEQGLDPPFADPLSTNGILDASEQWCNLDPGKGPLVISLEFHGNKRGSWAQADHEAAIEAEGTMRDHQFLSLSADFQVLNRGVLQTQETVVEAVNELRAEMDQRDERLRTEVGAALERQGSVIAQEAATKAAETVISQMTLTQAFAHVGEANGSRLGEIPSDQVEELDLAGDLAGNGGNPNPGRPQTGEVTT